jgi:hypothetical protein
MRKNARKKMRKKCRAKKDGVAERFGDRQSFRFLSPTARGLFSRKLPPGPPQKLFIKKPNILINMGEKKGQSGNPNMGEKKGQSGNPQECVKLYCGYIKLRSRPKKLRYGYIKL